MGAKLIFCKEHGKPEFFAFCPLVKYGCAKCFVPPKCKGESDKTMAFNMRRTKNGFEITRYHPHSAAVEKGK